MQLLTVETEKSAVSPESEPKKPSLWHRPTGLLGVLIVILAGVLVLRVWFVEQVIVKGDSMYPTLRNGERLLAVRKEYDNQHLPHRGDIVIFKDPQVNEMVVKRVVALPKEFLMMFGTSVVVNGKRLNEPYAKAHAKTYIIGAIPEGAVWMLGDNRDKSADSRVYGPIPLKNILGRAEFRLWPFPPERIPRVEIQPG